MDNVIKVDFGKKKVTEQQCVPVELGLTAYLDSLRNQGIAEDDILDVIDAIVDKDMYFAADDVVQKFADGWLHRFL